MALQGGIRKPFGIRPKLCSINRCASGQGRVAPDHAVAENRLPELFPPACCACASWPCAVSSAADTALASVDSACSLAAASLSTLACFDSASIWRCNAESRCRSALICAFNCLTTGLSPDSAPSFDDVFRPVEEGAPSAVGRTPSPFDADGGVIALSAEALGGRLSDGSAALMATDGSTRIALFFVGLWQGGHALAAIHRNLLRHVVPELEEVRSRNRRRASSGQVIGRVAAARKSRSNCLIYMRKIQIADRR